MAHSRSGKDENISNINFKTYILNVAFKLKEH